MERVVVVLHIGSADVRKVWRFDTNSIKQYVRAGVEAELVELFPDVARKGLKFDLWYEDDLAGKVCYSYNIYFYSVLVLLHKLCCRWQLKVMETSKAH